MKCLYSSKADPLLFSAAHLHVMSHTAIEKVDFESPFKGFFQFGKC
jgi:hypothetical protein